MTIMTFDIDRERRDIDFAKNIPLLEPDAAPLSVVLMRARKQAAKSAEIVWWDDELGARWTKINNVGGYGADATTMTVLDATIFAPKDVVKVASTGEIMIITEVASATSIKVARGCGTTDAGNIAHEAWLLLLGNAMEEASKVPAEKLAQPTKRGNYCQIFRTPFSVSGTEEAEGVITNESERARKARKKGIEHRVDIERAILFGEKAEDATGKRRLMGGILNFVTTNVENINGPLTEPKFELFCETGFRYGASQKLFVASPRIISTINQWAAGRLELVPRDEVYGLHVRRYLSAHGEVLLVKSNVLENAYAGYGMLLDFKNIAYRPLRDTKLRRNIQSSDEDAVRDEYFTEATLQVELEKTHAVMYGVTVG